MVTSNHERDLPEPFLRRCVHEYLKFPTPEQMTDIVRAHIPDINAHLLETAVKRFYEIREIKHLEKKPSTSEMLDWIRALIAHGIEEVGDETLFPGTLVKTREDHERLADLVTGQDRQEELRAVQMPESVIAALHGEQVVHLKPHDGYVTGMPDNTILVQLANSGIPFVTASSDYNNRRDFDITIEGLRRVDTLTFAITQGSPAAELFNKFSEQNLIDKIFVVTHDPVEFVTVDESNELFMRGKDVKGRTVYKTPQGEVVYEDKLIVMDGPLGGMGLSADQVFELNKAGFGTSDKIFNILKAKQDETLLAIPTIGRQALANMKKGLRKMRADFPDDEDDDDEPLGSSTLRRISGADLFTYPDEEDES